jgi:hypothetical protein
MSFTGCASYQRNVEDGRRLLRQRQFEAAADFFRSKAERPSDDQLVYLFDYGTVLQTAGRYRESNSVLLKANDLIDLKDYHSVSRIAGSMALNEGFVQYKGEDFEKVLVNALLAINFLSLGEPEAALVETKRINEKLDYLISQGKKSYQQNEFAYYLAGMIWELNKQWDSAFIDYSKVLKLRPDLTFVSGDLLRAADLGGRKKDKEEILRQRPDLRVDPKWRSREQAEVILLFQQGWGPRKIPRPENVRFPMLVPVPSTTAQARLVLNEEIIVPSRIIYDLEKVAINTLNDDYAALVARRMGGLAAKAVVSDQLRQKNEGLGQLAWIAMNLADQADLRQWSTLPRSFQVARVFVPAGRYLVRAEGLAADGESSGENSPDQEIELRPGAKFFLSWRSLL